MSIHITQLSQKRSKVTIIYIILFLSLLSLYPIYKNFYNGAAVKTYERHIALIEGNSEYYNPWQYRMLSPMIVEGLMFMYNNTIDRLYPIEEKLTFTIAKTSEPTPETKEFIKLLQTKGAIKYLLIFLILRFFLNITVFLLAWYFWRHFVSNELLIFFGLMFLSMGMGNAVIASDLTFNTYFDIIFYLLAALIIVKKRNPAWIIPIVMLSAFNRETSILIPFLFFISNCDFSNFNFKNYKSLLNFLPSKRIWLIAITSFFIFLLIFIGLRIYYGYQPQQVWKVPAGIQMIRLNLVSAVSVKSYFEMLGLFSVIPIVILLRFRSLPIILRTWFICIVPLWFTAHIYSVVIYQTRLFLVPSIIIFMPMFLFMIDNNKNIFKKSVNT